MKKAILIILAIILLTAIILLFSNKTSRLSSPNFTTPTPVSEASPALQANISSVSPAQNSKSVSLVTDISVNLDAKIDPARVSLSISPAVAYAKPTINGFVLTFAQQESLRPNTSYTLSLSGTINYSWSFTTGAGGAGQDLNYVKRAEELAPAGEAAYQKALYKNYLFHKMPYSTPSFSISYNLSVDLFTVSVLSSSGKQDALSWISSQNVDPTTLRIQYK